MLPYSWDYGIVSGLVKAGPCVDTYTMHLGTYIPKLHFELSSCLSPDTRCRLGEGFRVLDTSKVLTGILFHKSQLI